MRRVDRLRVGLFADGAELEVIERMSKNPLISGFTTNPTLMRKAGITDYVAFARQALTIVRDLPISFEVFADDFATMEFQAREIASWGRNVFVKVPVTNTRGESSAPLVARLSAAGVQLNVTAILTEAQVAEIGAALSPRAACFISVFAGRIADTGRDPVPVIERTLALLRDRPLARVIWASPRELLNIFQADAVGCHVITATSELLDKLSLVDKDLTGYSLETVEMFHRDAMAAGYSIPLSAEASTRL